MRILITASAIGILALGGPALAQSGQNWGGQTPTQASPFPSQGSQYGSPGGVYGQQVPYGNQQQAPYQGQQQAPHQGQYGQGAGATTQPGDYRHDGRQQQRVARGNLAVDVDTALHGRGYDVGVVDGNVDAQSRAAIRAYERSAGLAMTGEPSQALLAHIESNQPRAGNAVPQSDASVGGVAGQAVDRLLKQSR